MCIRDSAVLIHRRVDIRHRDIARTVFPGKPANQEGYKPRDDTEGEKQDDAGDNRSGINPAEINLTKPLPVGV